MKQLIDGWFSLVTIHDQYPGIGLGQGDGQIATAEGFPSPGIQLVKMTRLHPLFAVAKIRLVRMVLYPSTTAKLEESWRILFF